MAVEVAFMVVADLVELQLWTIHWYIQATSKAHDLSTLASMPKPHIAKKNVHSNEHSRVPTNHLVYCPMGLLPYKCSTSGLSCADQKEVDC